MKLITSLVFVVLFSISSQAAENETSGGHDKGKATQGACGAALQTVYRVSLGKTQNRASIQAVLAITLLDYLKIKPEVGGDNWKWKDSRVELKDGLNSIVCTIHESPHGIVNIPEYECTITLASADQAIVSRAHDSLPIRLFNGLKAYVNSGSSPARLFDEGDRCILRGATNGAIYVSAAKSRANQILEGRIEFRGFNFEKSQVVIKSAPVATLSAEATLVAKGADQFGLNLLGKLSGGDGNVFYSPFSVAAALGLVRIGARGQTADEIATVLGLQGLNTASIADGWGNLLKTLISDGSDGRSIVRVANSVWAGNRVKVQDEFSRLAREKFGSEARVLGPNALANINDWVAQATDQKITKLLDSVDPTTVLILLNAIYFKGKWQYTFDKNDTTDEPFYLLDGTEATVPMMFRKKSDDQKFRYFKDRDLQVLELPYTGGDVVMEVFLPIKKDAASLDALMKNLSPARLAQIYAAMKERPGSISLPRFKLDIKKSLLGTLASLGMRLPFEQSADFSGLLTPSEGVYIGDIIHQAVVEVDEEGTVAAAATAIEFEAFSIMDDGSFRFVADHPFYFQIRHKNGPVLFAGILKDPSKK